jgi:predicted dehydrogenase
LINRVLIVGLGSIGSRHLRLARHLLPNAEIKVLRHQETNSVPEFSNGCMSSIVEALEFSPQIAVIANPATFHLKPAQSLAEAGVNLLIEKPLSDSVEGISKLIETCRAGNTTLATGYNLRFSPSMQHFRQVLKNGIIGEIFSVRCEVGQYLPTWRPSTDYRQGVSAKRILGGGALLELSHEIDYLRWIFGDVEWVRSTLSKQSDLEIDVEDSASLTIGFTPNSAGKQVLSTINLDFIRHDYTRLCTVIGENGTLTWDGVLGRVMIYAKDSPFWVELYSHQPVRDETYIEEWNDFLMSIQENKPPFVTGEDGLRVIEIIEAVRESSQTGIQVQVDRLSTTKGFSA